jgi:hypothetical protein
LSEASDETLPRKYKRCRLTRPKDLVDSESLLKRVAKNLDALYQDQEHHRRIITTIVGKIETENRKLISKSRKLLDSQIYRPCKEQLEGFGGSQGRTLDLAENLLGQQRCLFENGFKCTEQLARTVVAHLDEGMWAQQCRVLGMKQFIQQHGQRKEGN